MVRVNDGCAEAAREGDEARIFEAFMTDFDGVAQWQSVELAGQQLKKRAEVGLVEFLGRRELPEQGAEFVLQVCGT